MNKISRRTFLKSGLAAAGALGAASVAVPATVRGAGKGELATLLDIGKCIGCGECVQACKEANEKKYPEPKKPFPKMYPARVKVADWSDRREVDGRLTPYNWLFVQEAQVEHEGEVHYLSIPRRCMHCRNPPCADLCPFGAARKLKNGITLIDPDICLGGKKCQVVCPWHIPERQTGVGIYLDIMPGFAGNGVMYKCDRCYNLLEKGESPACIEICPEQVQTIGPRDEILKQAHELAQKIGGYIYGENENGGTNTFYVSPVPFEKINQAIEKGPGRPSMGPVADTMKNSDNLAKAMLIAPIAGIVAGAFKFGGFLEKNRSGEDS